MIANGGGFNGRSVRGLRTNFSQLATALGVGYFPLEPGAE